RVPAEHYIDPAQTRAEIDALFHKRPLLVALTPDLPAPGSYLTHEAEGTSLLLVRDDEGRVRTYINACRHRGARIAEGRGSKQLFTCPFHAWSYGRDGQVVSRPGSCGGFDDTGDEFAALREIPCLEVAGMIFVLLQGDDIEAKVNALVGEALEDLESYRFGDNIRFDGRSIERNCNYKFILDAFTETYHIKTLHRKTVAPYYYGHPTLTDAMGPTVRIIGVRSSIDKEFAKPAADRRFLPHGTTQYLIPPNIVLVYQVDHVELWQFYPVDGAADRCRALLSLYWPAPMDDEAKRKAQFNLDVIWQVTTEEDIPQSLAIHNNLASGAIKDLVFGRNEPALIHYHQQIAKAIGSTQLCEV
ncbi:MAG: SRPBCC family protein, partial [Pseudomonadota bacterium]